MSTLATITRLHNLLERNITQINPPLDYSRVVRALEVAANALNNYQGENEDWLYIGEFTCPIDAFIVGGYWHLTEWHNGQWSDSYRALCALGNIYSPGYENGPEDESSAKDIYEMLEQLANENHRQLGKRASELAEC